MRRPPSTLKVDKCINHFTICLFSIYKIKKVCESACFSVILTKNKLLPHSPLSDLEKNDLVF